MTLTFEIKPEIVKMNQRVKYLGQRSFSLKVIVRTHSHTDCSTWITKVIGNQNSCNKYLFTNRTGASSSESSICQAVSRCLTDRSVRVTAPWQRTHLDYWQYIRGRRWPVLCRRRWTPARWPRTECPALSHAHRTYEYCHTYSDKSEELSQSIRVFK